MFWTAGGEKSPNTLGIVTAATASQWLHHFIFLVSCAPEKGRWEKLGCPYSPDWELLLVRSCS